MKLRSILGLCLSSSLLLGFSAASADEAEDSSAEFEAGIEELGAMLGVADPESTIATDENGITSATVGFSAMKMLVVRQNEDGTLSYEHVSTDEDAKAFVESTETDAAAEE